MKKLKYIMLIFVFKIPSFALCERIEFGLNTANYSVGLKSKYTGFGYSIGLQTIIDCDKRKKKYFNSYLGVTFAGPNSNIPISSFRTLYGAVNFGRSIISSKKANLFLGLEFMVNFQAVEFEDNKLTNLLNKNQNNTFKAGYSSLCARYERNILTNGALFIEIKSSLIPVFKSNNIELRQSFLKFGFVTDIN